MRGQICGFFVEGSSPGHHLLSCFPSFHPLWESFQRPVPGTEFAVMVRKRAVALCAWLRQSVRCLIAQADCVLEVTWVCDSVTEEQKYQCRSLPSLLQVPFGQSHPVEKVRQLLEADGDTSIGSGAH